MRTIEVISGKERRRRFNDVEKMKILEEWESGQMSMKSLAAKYGLSNSLLYVWRNKLRNDGVTTTSPRVPPGFVSVMASEQGAGISMPVSAEPIRLHLFEEMLLELPSNYAPSSLVELIASLKRLR
jgi:transposase